MKADFHCLPPLNGLWGVWSFLITPEKTIKTIFLHLVVCVVLSCVCGLCGVWFCGVCGVGG